MRTFKTSYNQFRAKIFLILILTLMAFCLPFASAFNFDNSKSYNAETKTATITNAFGMGSDIAKIKLLTPHLNYVPAGSEVLVAEMEFENYGDYETAFNDMKFYDVNKGNKELTRTYIYRAWDDKIKNWTNFDRTKGLKKGTIRIGVFTNVNIGDKVEWIPTLYGVEINEWALFEYFNGVATGQADVGVTGASLYTAGQTFTIGLNGTNTTIRMSKIGLLISKKGSPSSDLNITIMNTTGTTPVAPNLAGIINGSIVASASLSATSSWMNVTLTGVTLYAGKTYAIRLICNGAGCDDANHYLWNFSALDPYAPSSQIGRAWSGENMVNDYSERDMTFEIYGDDVLAERPIITLLNPLNNTNFTNPIVNFTGNFSMASGNLKNATLYVWDSGGTIVRTNFTILDNTANQLYDRLESNFFYGTYKYNFLVEALNSTGDYAFNWASNNYSFSIYPAYTVVYNSSVLKFDENWIYLNMTYNSTMYSTSQTYLWYDSSRIIPTKLSDSGGLASYKGGVSTSVGTKSFFWEMQFINSTGSLFGVNTTSFSQTVNDFLIDNCSLYSVLAFNFTLKDEQTQAILNAPNMSIESEVIISSLINQSNSANYTTMINQSSLRICFSKNLTSSYRTDATVRYSATGYAAEYYYFKNFLLSNSTIPQHVNLFDLALTDSTEFIMTYKNENFLPVENAIIVIKRKYISEGVFKTVEMAKTDQYGQAKGHFDTDNVEYGISVFENGVLTASFDNIAVFCEDVVTGNCKIRLDASTDSPAVIDFESYAGVIASLSFNETERKVTLSFSSVDGGIYKMSLNLTRFDNYGNTSLCTNYLESSSGTLTCVVANSYGNLTFSADVYSGNQLLTSAWYQIIPDTKDIFGDVSVIFLIGMFITIPIMFIPTSLIGVLIGLIIGLIFGTAAMFMNTNVIGATAFISWAIIAIVIIIWKINQKGAD